MKTMECKSENKDCDGCLNCPHISPHEYESGCETADHVCQECVQVYVNMHSLVEDTKAGYRSLANELKRRIDSALENITDDWILNHENGVSKCIAEFQDLKRWIEK